MAQSISVWFRVTKKLACLLRNTNRLQSGVWCSVCKRNVYMYTHTWVDNVYAQLHHTQSKPSLCCIPVVVILAIMTINDFLFCVND